MDSVDTEKLVSTGKKREDRGTQSKNRFDPLHLEVKYPESAIFLLKCQEKPVLLAAAAALSKFGTKSQENLKTLFDLEIVNNVIPLIEHNDLFTRRFAAKLLAEMTVIPSVRNYLLESEHYIPYFTKVLINEQDIFMQEFSSLILAELSKDTYGAAKLLQLCSNMNFLFERIQSLDPDVKKNNIEIIYNLLQDPAGAEQIINAKEFNLILIYELFNEPYSEIQNLALDVIGYLVARNKDEDLQSLIRQTKGFEALLKILDNDEWHDLHSTVLGIFGAASNNHETVKQLDSIGGIRQIFNYMEKTSKSKSFVETYDIIGRLTQTQTGRNALYSYGIVEHLLNGLQGVAQPDIYRISCYGIGMMTQHSSAAKEITAKNPIKSLTELMKNEHLQWSVRQAAIFALGELLKCDIHNCMNLFEIEGVPLRKVPLEIHLITIQALLAIAKHPLLRDALIGTNLIDALFVSFEWDCRSTDEIKIASCNLLSKLCISKEGKDVFLKVQGPTRLYNLLVDVRSIPIRNAAAQLVQVLCTDSVLSNAFVRAKYLPYMLNNRVSARIVPSWETCIEALLNSHLPVKFAFTGRLSLHDVTQNGFYILRKNICPFPVLDDIFRFKFCPLQPVYVVNTTQTNSSVFTNNIPYKNNFEEAVNDFHEGSITEGVFLSSENIKPWLDLKFGRLQPDPWLNEYIDILKCKIFAMELQSLATDERIDFTNISYVASRAIMLAKFVVQQMSGPDPGITCINHQLDIHLKEIRQSIGTSVIPLGMLRVGSYLERAMLFKVLADRICLPSALVRGEYGKAWIEIAVPQIEIPVEETSFSDYLKVNEPCVDWIKRHDLLSKFTSVTSSKQFLNDVQRLNDQNMNKSAILWDLQRPIFSSKLMKCNYIVDLMDTPGCLIPIGSKRAKDYCENQLVLGTSCCA